MMKHYCYGLLSFMVLAMLSVSFASCGDEEENNRVVPPNNSGTTTNFPDPEGTLEVYLNAGTDPSYSSSKHSSILLGGTSPGFHDARLALDTSNNLAIWIDRYKSATGSLPSEKTTLFRIVSCGKVNGLGSITTVPSGWTYQTIAKEGNGYIVNACEYDNYNRISYYIRLYISKCNYDVSGNVVGVYVKYQPWTPEPTEY